jgi:hypothetical protein
MKMRLFLSVVAFLAAGAFDGVMAQQAASRPQVALLIGNAKYPDSETPLKEPVNDVRAMAEELRRQGFDVDVAENASREALQRALTRFYGKISNGSVALLFFSGYGVQSSKQTYLVPVDAQLWAEGDVKRDGMSLDSALGEMNARGAKVKIAVLDASRRNPFERRFRSFSAGLAPVAAPVGTLVMYSAAPSAVMNDAAGERGTFVTELIKQISTPGATAEEAFNRTRTGVSRATQGEQVPWLSSSLGEDFAFGQSGSRPSVASAPVAAAPASAAPTATAPAPAAPPPVSVTTVLPPAPVANAPIPAPSGVAKTAPPGGQPAPKPPASPSTAAPAQATALADDPAIKELDTRIKLNPRDGGAFSRRGQVFATKGDYTRAIRDFDEAVRINPGDAEALNNRCWTRGVVGDLQAALRDCNRALEIKPRYPDAFDSRGLVNLKLGLATFAINDYDAALKLSPNLASSLYGRGLAKVRAGNRAEGDSDMASAKAINPNVADEFAGYGLR